MFQFIRVASPKNAGNIAAAMQFGAEVTRYLNKTYGMKLRYGLRLFGKPQLYWEFEGDSVEKMLAVNEKLMQDREYLRMLEGAKELWVDGSLEDTIVSFAE